MKIARVFTTTDEILTGILEPSGSLRVFEKDLFEQDDLQLSSRTVLSSEIVRLLAPVTPPNILAIGLNYRRHAKETGMAEPVEPVVFIKATTSLIGPEDPICLPAIAPAEVDYEAELAIVIGKKTRHITPDQSLAHVLGYTCANDVTARDCQMKRDRQWARAKSFDTFCPLGPVITTDLDPDNLAISCRVNGSILQDDTTSDMIFDVSTLIAFLSQCVTLLPGTVILTGTPPGVGVARAPQVFLHAGDEVAVEIEGIGILKNPVINEQQMVK